MKKYPTLIIFSMAVLWSFGQNLVPNPSFENYLVLPCSFIQTPSQIEEAVEDWKMPSEGSTDIFSNLVSTFCPLSCYSIHTDRVGYQAPRTGNVMSAILTYNLQSTTPPCTGGTSEYREYLTVQLTSPLTVGESYYAEMYISMCDRNKVASNNIGMYFSQNEIFETTCSTLEFNPQINEQEIITDSADWVLISGTFQASGPWEYLTIGNFFSDENTNIIEYPNNFRWQARYFVDDVSVIPLDNSCLTVSADTTICNGDSIQLTANSDSFIGWSLEIGSSPFSTQETITIAPDVSTDLYAFANCDTLVVHVYVDDLPQFDLGPDTTICPENSFVLDASSIADSYLWHDNSTEPTYIVDSSGIFSVTATNGGCSVTDSIEVDMEFNDPNLGDDQIRCEGESVTLDASESGNAFLWNDGSENPTLTISNSGTYWVQVGMFCPVKDTIEITFSPGPEVSFEESLILCEGDTYEFNAYNEGAEYLWQDGSSESIYNVSEPGLYFVDVTIGGCTISDSIQVAMEINDPDLGEDQFPCEGEIVTLNATESGNTFLWNDGSQNSTLAVTQTGTYWVQVGTECLDSDTIEVTFSPAPEVSFEENLTLCDGDSVVLDAFNEGADYLWQDGSSESGYIVSEPGLYFVEVTIGACTASDFVEVEVIQKPTFSLGKDTLICIDEPFQLSAPTEYTNYFWQDGTNYPTQVIDEPGTYSLEVWNGCGSYIDFINVDFKDCSCYLYIPNAITPNEDGINDLFKVVHSCALEKYELQIFNRWGELIYQTNDPDKAWNGGSKSNYYVPNEVYVYQVTYKWKTPLNVEVTAKTGTVTVIR